MKTYLAFSAATIAALFGCASQPLEDSLQPEAMKVAQQRGASELACPAANAEVLSKHAIEEGQATGWYQAPRRAEYKVAVSGCGKSTTYLVECNKFRSACQPGPVPVTTARVPQQLADELQPDAIKTAQQRGAKEFACPATTAEVTRQETIDDGQTTGWYEPPRRAAYAVTVKGCGQETAYLVECDKEKNGGCATAALRPTTASPAHPELANELEPGAIREAQELGSKNLECPEVTATVNRKEIIEEAQMSGWYQYPYRALFAITIAGCGKKVTYLVACNKKRKSCAAGDPRELRSR